VTVVHHSAICVADVDEMDQRFDGDWPTLLEAPSRSLRAVFLGRPDRADAGVVELVGLGTVPDGPLPTRPAHGFLLLSVITDVEAALDRLGRLGLGGPPRRVTVSGVGMAVVRDPDGVQVELVDSGATANLERLAST
jgi:catechol 2,3-dioxygenase-like lactoylglutathione lyase family enzyme